jgi:dolichyl-phosphate beta-glucosyltransferase
MQPNYTASLILPLYRPSGDWVTPFLANVRSLETMVPAERLQYVVVHDGPADRALLGGIETIRAEVPDLVFLQYSENRGKGYALRTGVAAADGPVLVTVDFDFPYQHRNIARIIDDLRAGQDIVVGRRNRAYFRAVPVKRLFVSKFFSLLNRLFIPLPVFDTQSGMKGFNANGRRVFLETITDRFLVDTEFLMRAHKTDLAVGVIDIGLRPHVTFSDFGVKVIRTELVNFLRIARISRRLRRTRTIRSAEPLLHPGLSLRA